MYPVEVGQQDADGECEYRASSVCQNDASYHLRFQVQIDQQDNARALAQLHASLGQAVTVEGSLVVPEKPGVSIRHGGVGSRLGRGVFQGGRAVPEQPRFRRVRLALTITLTVALGLTRALTPNLDPDPGPRR